MYTSLYTGFPEGGWFGVSRAGTGEFLMRSLVVVNIVGLTPQLVDERMPNLQALASQGFQAELGTVLPAVTCSAQATMLTGCLPREHGIVGNGWYCREHSEIQMWKQSNHLVKAEKVWEKARARNSDFTCAKLFWWYNMYSGVDWSVTPRPSYHADGRKTPDFYAHPPELRDVLKLELGEFPLFNFWGPLSGIRSSEWIGRCAEQVVDIHRPTLTLVYLPHLDYDLQRYGPVFPGLDENLREVDRVAGGIIATARQNDMEVIVLSEYGITPVTDSISINLALRETGLLKVHRAHNGELLDAGASDAFALSDHQVAHVYVGAEENRASVKRLLEELPGIEEVLDGDGKAAHGLDHPRSGDLVAVAEPGRWFDYYYWTEEGQAPDFARTVDIHRKPGYDPLELVLDPARPLLKPRLGLKSLASRAGIRTLMDCVPLEPGLLGGSHGRLPSSPEEGPVLISSSAKHAAARLEMTEVSDHLLATIFD